MKKIQFQYNSLSVLISKVGLLKFKLKGQDTVKNRELVLVKIPNLSTQKFPKIIFQNNETVSAIFNKVKTFDL